MKLDDTLIDILENIQGKIDIKFKQNLSIEEISKIVDFQFIGLGLGVTKKMNVRLPCLGKFMNVNRMERRYERKEAIRLINENAKLNPEFNKEEVLNEMYKYWAIRTENNKKKEREVAHKVATIEEVLNTETVKKPVFKILKALGRKIENHKD